MGNAMNYNPNQLAFDPSELPEIAQRCFPYAQLSEWCYINDQGVEYYTFTAESDHKKIIFRFPRFDSVAQKVPREVELLKNLSFLHAQIPHPLFIGTGCKNYPYPFFGYPFISGVKLSSRVFRQLKSRSIALKIAYQLGQFLNDLHDISIDDTFTVTLEKQTRYDILDKFWEKAQIYVFPLLSTSQRREITHSFDKFLNNSEIFDFSPKLIHGDLTDQNIILNTDSTRIGIIDFANSHIGDPARDFADLQFAYGEKFVRQTLEKYQHSANKSFLRRIEFYIDTYSVQAILCGIELNCLDCIQWGLDLL